MDANRLLLWIAVASWTLSTVRAARVRGPRRLALLAWNGGGLLVCGVVTLLWPARAGWIAGGLWAGLSLLPALCALWVARLVPARRFALARALARVAGLLNPTPGYRDLLRVVELSERSARGEALESSVPVDPDSPFGRYQEVERLRSQGRWEELLSFTRAQPQEALESESALALAQVRALLELDDVEGLLQTCARFEQVPGLGQEAPLFRLLAAVRFGRVDLVDQLLRGPLRNRLAPDAGLTWRAIALQAAGASAQADALLRELAERAPASSAGGIARRLREPLPPAAQLQLSPTAQATWRQLELEIQAPARMAQNRGRAATYCLLASLALAFALELPGGSTDAYNLFRLGALLIPKQPPADEFWRVVTAAWLHLGPQHFVMNALGLWVFGRAVEAAIGGPRLLVVYLVSAIGANAVALFLIRGPALLVGASGGVLGLLGALLAIALHLQRRYRTRFLRDHVRSSLLVVVMQVAFDLTTPQVSSTVHVSGFALGFAAAWLLVASRPAAA